MENSEESAVLDVSSENKMLTPFKHGSRDSITDVSNISSIDDSLVS